MAFRVPAPLSIRMRRSSGFRTFLIDRRRHLERVAGELLDDPVVQARS